MTVAFDAASTSINVGGALPVAKTWTHTPVGTPAAIIYNNGWHVPSADPNGATHDSVSYGGVAMVLVGVTTAGIQVFEKWQLLSGIPTGAQTVTDNYSGGASTIEGFAETCSFTSGGTVALGTLFTGTGTTSPITKAVTGCVSTSVIDSGWGTNTGSSANITITTAGTNETKRAGTSNVGVSGDRLQFGSSTQLGVNGTVTPSETESANRTWRILAIELQEVIAVTSKPPLMMMMGVGM